MDTEFSFRLATPTARTAWRLRNDKLFGKDCFQSPRVKISDTEWTIISALLTERQCNSRRQKLRKHIRIGLYLCCYLWSPCMECVLLFGASCIPDIWKHLYLDNGWVFILSKEDRIGLIMRLRHGSQVIGFVCDLGLLVILVLVLHDRIKHENLTSALTRTGELGSPSSGLTDTRGLDTRCPVWVTATFCVVVAPGVFPILCGLFNSLFCSCPFNLLIHFSVECATLWGTNQNQSTLVQGYGESK